MNTTTTTTTITTTQNVSATYHDYGIPVTAALSFFLIVSMVLSLIGNTMVIITILRHPGMRTRTNMLLGNLAVADILVAVLDMPVALITIINRDWVLPEAFCDFNGFAVGLGLMLSVHTLMWISIHKFFSITRPFARSITQFQIVLMMVAAWVWTIAYNLTATPLIGMTRTLYKPGSSQCGPAIPEKPLQYVHSALNTVFNMLIPMTVMACCYYKIFKEVQTHLERMRDFADVGMRNSLIQQKQITMTLLIVLIVFFLFWLPFLVYSMSLVFCGEMCVPRIFNPISYLFGYMNSACNPVIYALRSPSFRRGFQEILFGKSARATGRKAIVVESFRKSILKPNKQARPQPPKLEKATPKANIYRTSTIKGANGKRRESRDVTKDDAKGRDTSRTSRVVTFSEGAEDDLGAGIQEEPYYAPWEPLQTLNSSHLSASNQEICAPVQTSMTRSASANDIPKTTEKAKNEVDLSSKRRHKSEIHRPLVWQASVDHLVIGEARRGGGRVKTGQQQQHTHLAVRTLIRNVRRSLSDLFSVEEV